MGQVIEFASSAPPPAKREVVIAGDGPLITLLRVMIDAGYGLPDIATFFRDQAAILDQVAERLAHEEAHRPA